MQVQGVQSLQGLQLPQGQGQAQQLTLAPVQTLPLGQAGQVSLPNLQTVTVNSVTQAGVQYTHGDETGSPVGTTTDITAHISTLFIPIWLTSQPSSFFFLLQVSRLRRSPTQRSGS